MGCERLIERKGVETRKSPACQRDLKDWAWAWRGDVCAGAAKPYRGRATRPMCESKRASLNPIILLLLFLSFTTHVVYSCAAPPIRVLLVQVWRSIARSPAYLDK